jgi:protein-tyrosine phosphatase
VKQVLFLCSANYYRSRFAEHYFNWLAPKAKLPWRADSRGLLVGFWGDVGPIYRCTVEALRQRGVPVDGGHREPMALTLADLKASHLVVAVKEVEHRPLMADQFPDWEDRVEYWHIDDLDCAPAELAIPRLEEHVKLLVDRLATQP